MNDGKIIKRQTFWNVSPLIHFYGYVEVSTDECVRTIFAPYIDNIDNSSGALLGLIIFIVQETQLNIRKIYRLLTNNGITVHFFFLLLTWLSLKDLTINGFQEAFQSKAFFHSPLQVLENINTCKILFSPNVRKSPPPLITNFQLSQFMGWQCQTIWSVIKFVRHCEITRQVFI